MTHNSARGYQFNVTMVTDCGLTIQFEYHYYCNFVEIHCINYCFGQSGQLFMKDHAEFKKYDCFCFYYLLFSK